jgi:sensor histidine kinase YesM
MTDHFEIEQSAATMRSHLTFKHVLLEFFYTIIISFLVAGFITIVGIVKSFLISFVMSLSFGISIVAVMNVLFWLFNPERDKTLPMVLVMMAGIVGGMIIGIQVGSFLLRHLFSLVVNVDRWDNLKTSVLVFAIGGTITYFFYSKGKLKMIREAVEKERINRLASEKEALESNLRLLQAQIEPHFLFNTLSNILSLIDTEPSKGKSMLMDLIHYLRTSLSRTLPDTTTLDQEIDAIKAYLNIQKIRLGDRLNFTIDIPETLRQHPFPPMLIQPLVENAIKHGLEPKVTGGEISITITEENGLIRITVADTGAGFSSLNASGVGIANVKERIHLIYGKKGRLLLEEKRPAGVRAVIEVPRNGV